MSCYISNIVAFTIWLSLAMFSAYGENQYLAIWSSLDSLTAVLMFGHFIQFIHLFTNKSYAY